MVSSTGHGFLQPFLQERGRLSVVPVNDYSASAGKGIGVRGRVQLGNRFDTRLPDTLTSLPLHPLILPSFHLPTHPPTQPPTHPRRTPDALTHTPTQKDSRTTHPPKNLTHPNICPPHLSTHPSTHPRSASTKAGGSKSRRSSIFSPTVCVCLNVCGCVRVWVCRPCVLCVDHCLSLEVQVCQLQLKWRTRTYSHACTCVFRTYAHIQCTTSV